MGCGGMKQKCIVCNKEITIADNILKLFWAPWNCDISIVYKFVCSYHCWTIALDDGMKDPEGLVKRMKKSFEES